MHGNHLLRSESDPQQGGAHRRIDTAANQQQHFVRADFLADVLDAALLPARHRVRRRQSADVDAEVGQHLFAVHREIDLRMELDAVDLALGVVDGGDDLVGRLGGHLETGAEHVDAVAVR